MSYLCIYHEQERAVHDHELRSYSCKQACTILTTLKWFREDPLGYCKNMKGDDPDLAAHFTIINKYGTVLCGKEIAEAFSEVPKEAYLNSIQADIEEAVSSVVENPIYIILNLCRVAAYVKSGLVLSKEQGGLWGIEHLEAGYHPLIHNALKCYWTGETMLPNQREADVYCKSMLEQIFGANPLTKA